MAMQNKLISFTLFGQDPKYYVGAEKNLILQKNLLPDWSTRIYYHPSLTDSSRFHVLQDLGAELIDVSDEVRGGKHSIEFPYFWRFFPFEEEGSLCIVRDLDSRLSNREVEYVRRWEESDRTFFIIRDHPWQSPVPSGLFGMRNRDNSFKKHFNSFMERSTLGWGTDQEILHEYIQQKSAEDIDYFGYDKPESYIVRDDSTFFIGIQLDENDKPTEPSGRLSVQYINEIGL